MRWWEKGATYVFKPHDVPLVGLDVLAQPRGLAVLAQRVVPKHDPPGDAVQPRPKEGHELVPELHLVEVAHVRRADLRFCDLAGDLDVGGGDARLEGRVLGDALDVLEVPGDAVFACARDVGRGGGGLEVLLRRAGERVTTPARSHSVAAWM